MVEERGPRDLTLVDTCFLAEEKKLESSLADEGYDIKDVKRLILTHLHVDHVQAATRVKEVSRARVYSHWAEAGYLTNSPPYHGPPYHEKILAIYQRLGIRAEDVSKKFGSLERGLIPVDEVLRDGDSVGRLKVIHTPGHTPGHISLYSEEDRAVIGGDFLFKSVLGTDGLFLADSDLSIDPRVAAVSARRVSSLQFDRLLLGHQDAPLLERANMAVARVAAVALVK